MGGTGVGVGMGVGVGVGMGVGVGVGMGVGVGIAVGGTVGVEAGGAGVDAAVVDREAVATLAGSVATAAGSVAADGTEVGAGATVGSEAQAANRKAKVRKRATCVMNVTNFILQLQFGMPAVKATRSIRLWPSGGGWGRLARSGSAAGESGVPAAGQFFQLVDAGFGGVGPGAFICQDLSVYSASSSFMKSSICLILPVFKQ